MRLLLLAVLFAGCATTRTRPEPTVRYETTIRTECQMMTNKDKMVLEQFCREISTLLMSDGSMRWRMVHELPDKIGGKKAQVWNEAGEAK